MKTQTIKKTDLAKIHEIACQGWKTKIDGYASRNLYGCDVEITEVEIDEMFKAADASQKKVLLKFFKRPESIMDKIKSFKDAYESLGIKTYGDAYKLLKLKRKNFADALIKDCDDEFLIVAIIVAALNEGWIGDWNNSNESKYFPWFDMSDGSYYYYNGWSTSSGTSTRLCLKNADLAMYAGKQFNKEFKSYMLFK